MLEIYIAWALFGKEHLVRRRIITSTPASTSTASLCGHRCTTDTNPKISKISHVTYITLH
jgi:hypothetical protein